MKLIRSLLPLTVLLVATTASPLLAQTSASYRLEEYTINEGGHPDAGQVLTSTEYRITIDALGDAVVGRGLSSESYRMDSGFGGLYRPPGEVLNLRFSDGQTLVWDADKSVGDYALYRSLISDLYVLDYGGCHEHGITAETTTDSDTPPSTDGYYYLVTARNRLAEEGTKGFDSDDDERANDAPCP